MIRRPRAYVNGITSVTGESCFNPNSQIDREKFAVMMFKAAVSANIDLSDDCSLNEYTDKDTISGWALQSMSWAVKQGLMSGTGSNCISPKAVSTRAQICVIAKAFCGLIH